MSASAWADVIPLVAGRHEVFALNALGHKGGPPITHRPVTATDLVDTAEHDLDRLGLQHPHIAGNSIGGYIALQLARRGRATTVCAFGPPGFWPDDPNIRIHAIRQQQRNTTMARIARFVAPVMFRSAKVRRIGLRDSMCHGDRLSPARAVGILDDSNACVIGTEVFQSLDKIEPMDPLPCPVTVAWSQNDAFFPLATYRPVIRDLMPQAKFIELPGVGHVCMLDDPQLAARTILEVTGE